MAPAKGPLIYLHSLRAPAPEKSVGQPGHSKLLEGWVYCDFITDFSDFVYSFATVLITLSRLPSSGHCRSRGHS